MLAKFPRFKALILFSVFASCIAVFFLSKYIHPSLDLPRYLVNRQQEFLALEAGSAMQVQVPEPNFTGFLKVLPSATANVLFRPLPGEGSNLYYLAHSLEIYLFWGIVLFMAFKNRFRIQPSLVPNLVWAFLLFAVCNLLIIGYIVPNIGAMVRYRSIFLPWLALFFWYLFNGNNWQSDYRLLLSNAKPNKQ